MTDSISPSSSAYHPHSQSPAEAHRMFEIQFETAVLGIFVATTGQDGSAKRQVSQLKNGIKSGAPTAELGTSLNQLVSQINTTVVPGKALFPAFLFTSEGSQVQALTHHAITLQKCLNTLSENGGMPWEEEKKLFTELSTLVRTIPQLTPKQAFDTLNEVIEKANTHLPSNFQIPPLPLS